MNSFTEYGKKLRSEYYNRLSVWYKKHIPTGLLAKQMPAIIYHRKNNTSTFPTIMSFIIPSRNTMLILKIWWKASAKDNNPNLKDVNLQGLL